MVIAAVLRDAVASETACATAQLSPGRVDTTAADATLTAIPEPSWDPSKGATGIDDVDGVAAAAAADAAGVGGAMMKCRPPLLAATALLLEEPPPIHDAEGCSSPRDPATTLLPFHDATSVDPASLLGP